MADDREMAWVEPSDEEKHLMAEKRMTRDRISAQMGQYLLKGYKMLDKTCGSCGTILLQSKDGQNHCIYCESLASAGNGNTTAALQHTADPSRLQRADPPQNVPQGTTAPPQSFPQPGGRKTIAAEEDGRREDHSGVFTDAQAVIVHKMQWATQELGHSTSVESSIQLCRLIRELTETLGSLEKAGQL